VIAAPRRADSEKWLDLLAGLASDSARRKFLDRHKWIVSPDVVTKIGQAVVQEVRIDTQRAVHLAEAGLLIASRLHRKDSMAHALRAKANVLYLTGQNKEAVEHHERAIALYDSLGDGKEAARTLSSSIQPLILMGEYDQALAASQRAKEIFSRLNEAWRLARLEINTGNIFHRQDRFEEALAHYEHAYEGLLPYQDAEGIAVVLTNMSVCLIGMNNFARALTVYRKARAFCEKNDMPLLVAQADYNVAYLYYLRGEYSQAIEMLYAARRACETTGDSYHFALCYLDLSDVYLELNLSEEAREMAHEGFLRFEKLGMRYEAAKTLANEATAYGQQGKSVQALELFGKARAMFLQEKNVVWPWLLDLYQALVLFHEGRYYEARRLCTEASEFFDQTLLPGKAVLAHLLQARISFQLGELDVARKEIEAAFERLKALQAPVLAYQAHFLLGQIERAAGHESAAYDAYQQARQSLEGLRSRLQAEELKISFVKNRMGVYEALVDLCLNGEEGERTPGEAFGYIEAAKSRSMIEMIFQGGQSLPLGESGQSDLVRRIRDLREELNWYYHRIELEQLRPEDRSRERVEKLQQLAQAHESELLRTLRELPANERENAVLETSADFSLDTLQASIPKDAALLEYYAIGDRLLVAVVTCHSIQILPITIVSKIVSFLQLLRFQISKFRMGTEYVQRFSEPLLRATLSHLEVLYSELIAPIREHLSVRHLILVPHGPLHFLPFHALRSEGEYLCDSFTISYAPSATVFALCQQKSKPDSELSSLILGLPDDRAPEILEEVQSVARILPRSELLLGDRATANVLRERGAECGLLHIASHGVYRQDNPMFSGIRLGDGYLNLHDLYQIRLKAKLVTLSGCATGMNVVAAGDELLGLQRGFFCAGAASLLLSLWDVHDRSAAELMQAFYRNLISSESLPLALQKAMLELRERFPHPYYWAPFVLAGQISDSISLN